MQFSKTSDDRLKTCDKRLQSIMYRAIQISKVDFGIAEGHRTVELQKKYFAEGKSKLDGVTNLSKHNEQPSKAVDIYGYLNGKAVYDTPVMCYLAGVIEASAAELGYNIRWGGNWDNDGEIIKDQTFNDLPHYELT